ncbi:MAG TPA: hypothetical protein VKD72_35155, partial [Gemmataceae bacterium]|nr:hypothetical protein [Gemmataceae bacterium]
LHLWDVGTGKRVRSFVNHAGNITGARFLDDGKKAISSDNLGAVRVWDVATGKEIRSWSHGGNVNDLEVSPDGKRALTAGYADRLVKLWDVGRGTALDSFEGHLSAALGVAFSPDGKQALSCDAIATVRLWRLGR